MVVGRLVATDCSLILAESIRNPCRGSETAEFCRCCYFALIFAVETVLECSMISANEVIEMTNCCYSDFGVFE